MLNTLSLKRRVWEANLELVERNLVIYTWGNVSGIDRQQGIVAIKPSGVEYSNMTPDDIVVLFLETGEVVEGDLRPSSDTPTHLELYRKFPEIGGITHTHSTYAVAFSQAGTPIKALGTTHADYFYGEIPCSRILSPEETKTEYEANTGKVIVETFDSMEIDPMAMPGVLVRNHGPFTWGTTPDESVYHAAVLEEIAKMNFLTFQINNSSQMPTYILDKHYLRKHGANAYYGQARGE